jgi:uncharacterized phosphosugar-binding protein
MDMAEQFLEAAQAEIHALVSVQLPKIRKAAVLVADSWERGGCLQVSRTQHSLHTELVDRASGPVACKMLAGSDGPHDRCVTELGEVAAQDVILIHANCGNTAKAVSIAMLARKRGIATIALTQVEFETAPDVRSEHSTGALLHEVADVTVDLGGVVGDGSLEVPRQALTVAPTSGLTGVAAAWAIVARACELLALRGGRPLILRSVQLPGAEAHNQAATHAWRDLRRRSMSRRHAD